MAEFLEIGICEIMRAIPSVEGGDFFDPVTTLFQQSLCGVQAVVDQIFFRSTTMTAPENFLDVVCGDSDMVGNFRNGQVSPMVIFMDITANPAHQMVLSMDIVLLQKKDQCRNKTCQKTSQIFPVF